MTTSLALLNILCLSFGVPHSAATHAYDITRVEYAKIKEDCYFFRSPDITDKSFNNVYFILPESYFVSLVSEPNTMITQVRYDDIVGYVSSDTISKVDFTPVNPTLKNMTFDIKADTATQIWKVPDTEDVGNASDVVIPAGAKNIRYIASALGNIPNKGSSNVWYYTIYSPASDPTGVYQGYVYSGKTENLSAFVLNTEGQPELDPSAGELDDEQPYAMDSTVRLVLIILICVPIVLVFVLLIVSNHKNKNKEIIKAENNLSEQPDPPKPPKTRNLNRQTKHFKTVEEFEGQTLERKPPSSTKFLDTMARPTTANLRPEFPTYEVIDDDELL